MVQMDLTKKWEVRSRMGSLVIGEKKTPQKCRGSLKKGT